MENNNEKQTVKTKKEEVVAKEVETKELVEVSEDEKAAKKAKIKGGVIKGLKIAGIALGGAVLGFICGRKSSGNNEYYDESDIVEGEIVDSDN